MKFNRRDFIKSTSLISAGFFLSGNKLINALVEDSGNIKPLRGNIGIYTERGGTIGWYIADDAVVVIDSQFPDTAANFISQLKKKTDKKIDMLINTHHHGDHTSGNVYMQDYAEKIIANERAVELQKKFYGSGDGAGKQAYADVTFDEEFSTEAGTEIITARHFWPAHTGGDAVIHFENSNVVHMGDIVFNGVYPYIDPPGGSDLTGWIKYLEKSLNIFDNDTLFIYGHGQTVNGGKEDLNRMKNYLSALLDYVQKQINGGKSKDEVAASGPVPGFEDQVENWEGALKMSLNSAYDELIAG